MANVTNEQLYQKQNSIEKKLDILTIRVMGNGDQEGSIIGRLKDHSVQLKNLHRQKRKDWQWVAMALIALGAAIFAGVAAF